MVSGAYSPASGPGGQCHTYEDARGPKPCQQAAALPAFHSSRRAFGAHVYSPDVDAPSRDKVNLHPCRQHRARVRWRCQQKSIRQACKAASLESEKGLNDKWRRAKEKYFAFSVQSVETAALAVDDLHCKYVARLLLANQPHSGMRPPLNFTYLRTGGHKTPRAT